MNFPGGHPGGETVMSALDDSDLRVLLGDVLALATIEQEEDGGAQSELTRYMLDVAEAAAEELARREL